MAVTLLPAFSPRGGERRFVFDSITCFLSNNLRKEAGDEEHEDACNEDGYRGAVAPLPFLKDDAPHIAEDHVQSHEYAERERGEHWRGSEEALAQGKPEELTVPQCAGEEAEEEVVGPYPALAIVAPGVVVLVLPQTVNGVGHEAAEGNE